MRLLSGASLREAITRVSGGKTVSCAVAFWGKGAEELIGPLENRKVNLICNLKMGGTNPDVIDCLMKSGATVQQCDRLHAKVYIGDAQAVITSANASINGLGLEGKELVGWIETGVEVPAQEALPWFNDLWKQSRPILAQDLKDARRIFRERSYIKPSRGSFADFHPTREDFPLISWALAGDWDIFDNEVRATLGRIDEAIRKQIEDGFDVEAPEEKVLFRKGLWLLCWRSNADGTPRQRSIPWLTCSSGTFVPNAFAYKGEKPQGAVLAMHPMPPQLFDTSERRFRNAFIAVISRPKFAALRDQHYKGSFYTEQRQALMWQFWVDLKRHYNELSA